MWSTCDNKDCMSESGASGSWPLGCRRIKEDLACKGSPMEDRRVRGGSSSATSVVSSSGLSSYEWSLDFVKSSSGVNGRPSVGFSTLEGR